MSADLEIRFAGMLRLDMPYFGLSAEGARERRREERASLSAFVDDAVRDGVSYLVFTGDLFSEENLSFETVDYLLSVFEGNPDMHFVILPGASDPISEDSLYRSGRLPANVSVFHEQSLSRIDFPEVSFYGSAALSPDPLLLSDRKAADDGRLQVLLLHCPDPDSALLQAVDGFSADVTLFAGRSEAGKRIYREAPLVFSTGFSVGKTREEIGDGVYTALFAKAGEGSFAITLSESLYTNRRYLAASLDLTGVQNMRDVHARMEALVSSLPHPANSFLTLRLTGELPVAMLLPSTPELHGLSGLSVIDDTAPTAGTEVLSREMSVRGELYRSLSPGFSEEDPEDRRTVIESFRLGLRAIDDREAE